MTPADQITERMARLEPIAMRLEVKEGKNNCVLTVSYTHLDVYKRQDYDISITAIQGFHCVFPDGEQQNTDASGNSR